MNNRWNFWVDRGGTFTDIIAVSSDGELATLKLLSEDPTNYSDAVIEGIERLKENHSIFHVNSIRVGTTIATNALLERKGEKVLLIINKGFADLLSIRSQNRNHLFKQNIQKSPPLYSAVVEVQVRRDANGISIQELNEQKTVHHLKSYYKLGYRSLAVSLIHSLINNSDEIAIAKLASNIGYTEITLSHKTSTVQRLLPRAETTVADAYLTPLISNYSESLQRHFYPAPVYFMQSNGDLASPAQFRGKDAVLSGPAGGIVAMAKTAVHSGFRQIIGFDMGGTSTDVSIYTGEFSKSFDHEISGVPLQISMLDIHTVAAGGGSKLWFDGARLRVGPQSVGANPGPAGYRKGGELAVTDLNLILGRIQPECFPKIFGRFANQSLDREASLSAIKQITDCINQTLNINQSAYDLASSFLNIAVNNMANAIRQISTQKGIELHNFVINAFGGAGGQHACLVADELGIQEIFFHSQSSLLSAFGMGCASEGIEQSVSFQSELNASSLERIDIQAKQMIFEQSKQFSDSSIIESQITLGLFYFGSDNVLSVPLSDLDSVRSNFRYIHQQQFGFCHSSVNIMVQRITVESNQPEPLFQPKIKTKTGKLELMFPVYFQSKWINTPFIPICNLVSTISQNGPAVIYDDNTTIVVEPGWEISKQKDDNLVLQRVEKKIPPRKNQTQQDPERLEIFNNLFMYIAEQMGHVLQQTAHSVNIKERLDFSCAIFDTTGNLVANAPHMPVHLGSMSESVKQVIKDIDAVFPGDAFMLNSPFHGGTHLPDVTVVSPVFIESECYYWVASRGHHADIGGTSPGSMPANSTHIQEEGILIEHYKLLDKFEFDESRINQLLQNQQYPARNPKQTIADLKAQIAANQKGVSELILASNTFGERTVSAFMDYVQKNAERSIRQLAKKLSAGSFRYDMDCNLSIIVNVIPSNDGITFDFTGTSKQHTGNFNAPISVTRAAVLYVLRCLIDEEIPLNEGCLRPVNLIVPTGSFLNPKYPAAVVAGNVETSQCVTDAIFGALGFQAGAQGTMNNFTFGNEIIQYYETIAGGSGAGETIMGQGFNGADAIQTHMTNSRITDPEIIEQRFPVILEEFSIRKNSGGKGKYMGGNGVVRRFRFLQSMSVSLITNNRKHSPFGQNGGNTGKSGRNIHITLSNKAVILTSNAEIFVREGEAIEIHTPGGGGFGKC